MGLKSIKKTVAAVSAVTIAAVSSASAFVTSAAPASEYLDYASALQYSLYIYDANMCGKDVSAKSALTWRGNCHTNDVFDFNGKKVDLTGGYHDAGDHIKFGLPAAYSAIVLEIAYDQFGDAFKQTKQDAHLKTILDRFADYFKKCAVYEGDEVVAFAYQVGTGGGDYDHGYWGAPEVQPDAYKVGSRGALFTSEDNPCTDIVAATAAALAFHYNNYGDANSLKAAKDLYNYAMKAETKAVSKVPQYSRWDADYWDYVSMASLQLNKATKTNDYDANVNPNVVGKMYTDFASNWDGIWPLVNLYNNVSKYYGSSTLNSMPIVKGNNLKWAEGDGFRFVMEWGSARMNASLQLTGLLYDKLNGTKDYTAWAKNQMDFIFGNNSQKQAFMVGYNYRDDVKYPKYPHHRAADGGTVSPGTWDTSTALPLIQNTQKNVLVGALVGGPEDPGKTQNSLITDTFRYTDSLNNYVGNEVAIDYSAAFVASLAALYLEYGAGGKVVDPPSRMAPGVKDTYVIDSSLVTTAATTSVITSTSSHKTAPATADTGVTAFIPVMGVLVVTTAAMFVLKKKADN